MADHERMKSGLEREDGYDVIGDVHGHADKLVSMLGTMGYEERNGAWRHPRRQAVFVGDLIDRGPQQLETVRIARAMVEAESAKIVAGNHEFNAVAFCTPDPEAPGELLRKHSIKHREQHEDFLKEVEGKTSLHRDLIEWFMKLPLWLELDGLRVVHACWDPDAVTTLSGLVSGTNSLTKDLVVAASEEESSAWQAIEHLLKGPEVPIDPPYLDSGRHPRTAARFRWWLPDVGSLKDAVVMPGDATTVDGLPYPELPDEPFERPVAPYADKVPVIFGHFWETGAPTVKTDYTACVDYSAGNGGPLVAYRWSGESVLTNARFVASANA